MKVKVITPELRGGTLAFAPKKATAVSCTGNRLEIRHRSSIQVPLDRLRIASVVRPSKEGQPSLLLFVEGERRPFEVEATNIQFDQSIGPGDGPDLEADMRRFTTWLVKRSPGLGVDRATFVFLQGRPAPRLDRDVTSLSTSLGEILKRLDRE